jgi:rhamnosyl/mannosyltransferase
MRILHCFKVYRPDMNAGIPEVISQLCAGTPPGSQASILTCRSGGIGSRIIVDGVDVERTSTLGQISTMPISPTYLLRFYQRCRDVDILALHAPFPLVDICIELRLGRRPALVIHWHADIIGRSLVRPIFNPLLHNSTRRAARIIVTDFAMVDSSPYLGPVREKCRAAPYGIDTSYWCELTDADKAAIEGWRSKYPRLIVSCGRLVPYKGFDVLIRAMRSVDGHLAIIGTGPLEPSLSALVQGLGLEHRVTFVGYLERSEQKRLLNASRVFVLSSINNSEGFGIVQVEAMCCRLPVVNTSLPTTVPHVARDGLEALTVEPGNDVALGAAISRLLDEPDLAARLGHAGQARARSLYDAKTFTASVMNIYQEAVSEPRPRT